MQYAPYKLAEGNWDDIKEDVRRPLHRGAGRIRPERAGAIEHRQVLSPLDLERTFGITGGNIMQGAMALTSSSASAPSPAGPTIAPRSAGCTSAAPPATPAAA